MYHITFSVAGVGWQIQIYQLIHHLFQSNELFL